MCDPIGATQALRSGLADQSLPGNPVAFGNVAALYAAQLADSAGYLPALAAKQTARDTDYQRRPLHDYRRAELDRMWSDIVDNEHGFAEARHAFLHKQPAARAPRPRRDLQGSLCVVAPT